MPRKIIVYAFGSRGDTQPCVALGAGLQARGEKVRVVASRRYASLIAAAGLEHEPITVDPLDILESEEGQRWLGGGHNPVAFIRGFRRVVEPMAERLLVEVEAASEDADVILSPVLGFAGHLFGERFAVPYALLQFQPGEPTREFANPLVPRSLGPLGNRLSYTAVEQVTWQFLRPFLNRWRRRRLGLTAIPVSGPFRRARRERRPVLVSVSPSVVPRPRDWPAYVHQTGYWFLDAPWTPPDPLAGFLAAGPPPVYVGFGSMIPRDPARVEEIVRAALRRAGVRGILLGGSGPATDDLLPVEDAAHSWLFPRVAAVVHHGGAGTTAAALRAGVPSVICPFFSDQPFWARRVAALGASPAPLPIERVTPESLARAIRRAVTSPAIGAAAARLAARIRAEDGVAAACDLIDTQVA
ncbi:glycosyltransferase [Bailinhaonella thermotolerans]|uniref:Glycosyltransferase n=1 Tax=Bailinhaonella thermotolerans TaxID=1070861 RepID=A0A3A4BI68_9ACTN|nr:glycosyltransferase [Bailinhaonella thermotolerans]RJL30942.1 glycosyltransferase [Bailinhaonella thermotolerans]